MKTVLVTGARGTVGSYVVGLAEAAGHHVIVSDLRRAGLRSPVRGEVRVADLRDVAGLAKLVRGCDYVIHTAAQLNVDADPTELTRTNHEAVAALYQAAAEAGVRRFIQLSNATLYAPSASPLVETDPVAPRGAFSMSKRAAETFLQGQTEVPWTILRAAPLYGRRGRHFAASLLSIGPLIRMVSPIVPRPSGGAVGTMVHAEDVARAALFVLEREEAHGEIFNVSDGDAMSLGDRLAVTFDAYGMRSIGVGTAPRALLRAVGKLFQQPGAYHSADAAALAGWRAVVVRHRIKPALRPRLDREHLVLLYEDLNVDAGKLRGLGWTPRHDEFAAGWAEVLNWYQAERWVPRYG